MEGVRRAGNVGRKLADRARARRGKSPPATITELRPRRVEAASGSWGLSTRRQNVPLPDVDHLLPGNGVRLIEVRKLDGATMHLNEDLIERVESAAGGQSAVYLRYGGHMILASDPLTIVEMIRTEKVQLLRRVFEPPGRGVEDQSTMASIRDVSRLDQARGR